MKNIYLIVAPSGAGKTSITELLESKYDLKSIQSYTTRLPRYDGEMGHTFVSDEDFDKLTNMVAYTEFDNNRYCATSQQVEENDLYVIDPKGVEYFRQFYKGNKQIKIIYIESDLKTRYKRMVKRAESNGIIHSEAANYSLKRIVNDVEEFYNYIHCNAQVDFTIENNDNTTLESIVDKVYKFIICCETEVE